MTITTITKIKIANNRFCLSGRHRRLCGQDFIKWKKEACPETRLYLFLRTSTFVGIQPPVPKFEGNNKENKGNQNQTTDIKEDILVLQEIAGRIVGRKGERYNKAN